MIVQIIVYFSLSIGDHFIKMKKPVKRQHIHSYAYGYVYYVRYYWPSNLKNIKVFSNLHRNIFKFPDLDL